MRKLLKKWLVHQPRKFGVSKFGIERFVNGFLDLMTVTFVSRFGKKPMHFFGVLGTLMFFLGFLLFAYIGGEKLIFILNDVEATNIALQKWILFSSNFNDYGFAIISELVFWEK